MSPQPKLDTPRAGPAFRRPIRWCMVSLRHLPFTRKTLISLAMILSISGLTVALAQTDKRSVPVPVVDSDEQRFAIDSELALSEMTLDMTVDSTGDVDRDFVAMMMPHNQGAIDVARAELKYGHNEGVRRIAQSMIAGRETEISSMRTTVEQPTPAKSSGAPITAERSARTRIQEK